MRFSWWVTCFVPLGVNGATDVRLLLITFFGVKLNQTLPAFSKLWIDSCARAVGVTCSLNLVLLSPADRRTGRAQFSDCLAAPPAAASNSSHNTVNVNNIDVVVWPHATFAAALTRLDLNPEPVLRAPAKLSDLKPLYAALVNGTSMHIGEGPYTHWGWVDLDGAVGAELVRVLRATPCSVADVHTFYGLGMWHHPTFAGQITVFCNTPRIASLWRSVDNYRRMLTGGTRVSYFEEIHFPKSVRARNVTVREHMNKAADHDAFTRKVTDAYTVARGEVTNASGTPFVFVHFGFSKNKRGFKDAVAAGGCGAWGAYTARFDGAQQVVTVEHLSLAAAGAAGAAGGGGVGTG
jgi:hypothetical protein